MRIPAGVAYGFSVVAVTCPSFGLMRLSKVFGFCIDFSPLYFWTASFIALARRSGGIFCESLMVCPLLCAGQKSNIIRMDHCYMPLMPDSQERAQEAEHEDILDTLENLLRCECGAHVGAIRKPYLDGPNGGPLHPTSHYPAKPVRRHGNGKRGPSKSSGR